MNAGNSNVKSVKLCFRRNTAAFDQPGRKGPHLLIHRKPPDTREHSQTGSSSLRIPGRCLSDNQLGGKHFILRTPCRPPLSGNLLPRRRTQITARPGRKIADNRGFDIDGRLIHDLSLQYLVPLYKPGRQGPRPHRRIRPPLRHEGRRDPDRAIGRLTRPSELPAVIGPVQQRLPLLGPAADVPLAAVPRSWAMCRRIAFHRLICRSSSGQRRPM
jgi:hypothetical protein